MMRARTKIVYIYYMNTILQNLGFDEFFESQRKDLRIEIDSIARVVAEHKGMYHVKNSKGELRARVLGKQMYDAASREDYPVVGDWIEIAIIDNDLAIIKQILRRKTVIRKMAVSRKSPGKTKSQIIAANVDFAFVVEAVDRDYSLNRLERYFALAKDGGVQPIIILNKVDLISRIDLADKVSEIGDRFGGCEIMSSSTATYEGLDCLRNFLQSGKTYCFLGSSGVGKSSLINALIGESIVKTGVVGASSGRGKHVTTHREMYVLDSGGILIDNPGMREVGSANDGEGIKATFGEIENFAAMCQFADCSHIHESGCAVLEAVESGELDRDRYKNYIQLKKESKHYEMTDYEKRKTDKKFGQAIKNYHKRMRELE